MEFHLSFLNERQISGWGRGGPEGADQAARSQNSAVSGQTITSGLAQSSDMIGVDRRVSTVPETDSQGERTSSGHPACRFRAKGPEDLLRLQQSAMLRHVVVHGGTTFDRTRARRPSRV